MEAPDASQNARAAHDVARSFLFMTLMFSINHGCVIACLSLATARLGSVGAWQSGTLYLLYTTSALFGTTFVVKRLGARDAMIAGMTLYCVYVGAFWIATTWHALKTVAAITGAAIGGVGAGFLWTAQGSYFANAAEAHATYLNHPTTESTARFAGYFAFVYLASEVVLRAMSSILSSVAHFEWSSIFGTYAMVAIMSTVAMTFADRFDTRTGVTQSSTWYKVTAAWQLLRSDRKMKYMIGLNAVFGFAAAFVNSYVNGEVARVVLHDDENEYLGFLTAWMATVAATMSLVFGRLGQRFGKGPVLISGAVCFFLGTIPFVLQPNTERWNLFWLLLIYSFMGTGRATFEGSLKATFADYFSYEKEGAFANIIFQNGLSSAIGYILTFRLTCSEAGTYCIQYRDGSLHDVLSFELLILFAAVAAILGYLRASALRQAEESEDDDNVAVLLEEDHDQTV